MGSLENIPKCLCFQLLNLQSPPGVRRENRTNYFKNICRTPECLSRLSVRFLISAQVMISPFMKSSPTAGSGLTAQSLLGILSLPLSLPLPRSQVHAFKIKKKTNIKGKREQLLFSKILNVGYILPLQLRKHWFELFHTLSSVSCARHTTHLASVRVCSPFLAPGFSTPMLVSKYADRDKEHLSGK